MTCCARIAIPGSLTQRSVAGSLFALEVLHRAGVEFFEVIPFSVCAGLVCLLVFRKLTGEPYGGIWDFEAPITAVDWRHILLGAPSAGFEGFQAGFWAGGTITKGRMQVALWAMRRDAH